VLGSTIKDTVYIIDLLSFL